MQHYSIYSENNLIQSTGHSSCSLLGPEHGCPDSCAAGISVYSSKEFSPPQKHPFHEGFYVVKGEGDALVDTDIFDVHEGTSFFVPKNTLHSIRCYDNSPLTVFWFHSS